MQPMQPARLYPVADAAPSEAQTDQLPVGHHTVLAACSLCDPYVTWVIWSTYAVLQMTHPAHCVQDGGAKRADQHALVAKEGRRLCRTRA
jgi:hypothetical protein